jgi:NADH:ubiquinone oxidoreductase subunit 4 (subunit M)
MAFLSHWIATMLLLAVAGGAAAVAVVRHTVAARWVALGAMLLAVVLSLVSLIPIRWRQAAVTPAPPRAPLSPGWRTEQQAGIDAISLPFVILTTVLFAVLCLIEWNARATSASWLAAMLLMELMVVGAFVSLKWPLLYLFLAGVIVGARQLARQGEGERGDTRGFAIGLAIGWLCLVLHSISGPASFPLGVIGLLIWMAVVPFHLWLPGVVAGSAAAASVVVVLVPALGAYGLWRIGPAAESGMPWAPFAVLGVCSFLYGGLCAMAQRSISRFITYAVTVVMGFVLLGVAVRNPVAGAGAMILALTQGFAIVPLLYARERQGDSATLLSGAGWMGWLVAPVFTGQLLVVLGAFGPARTTPSVYGLAVAGTFGVVISAAAAARAAFRTRHPFGPVS